MVLNYKSTCPDRAPLHFQKRTLVHEWQAVFFVWWLRIIGPSTIQSCGAMFHFCINRNFRSGSLRPLQRIQGIPQSLISDIFLSKWCRCKRFAWKGPNRGWSPLDEDQFLHQFQTALWRPHNKSFLFSLQQRSSGVTLASESNYFCISHLFREYTILTGAMASTC